MLSKASYSDVISVSKKESLRSKENSLDIIPKNSISKPLISDSGMFATPPRYISGSVD